MATETKSTFSLGMPNILKLAKPFVSVLPRVKSPGRNSSLREKFIWTSLAILIYLVACQIPLYGISTDTTKDHTQWLKILIASSRGTLMDLGIGPILTTSFCMKFLNLCGLISADFSIKEDKVLYDSLEKVITILLTFAQAIVQIYTGFYGVYESLSRSVVFMIIIQLMISGLIVLLLDELLQKGYGFGNGFNLFIVTNVCERIIWNALSPRVYQTARGLEFEGALIAAFHILFSRRNKLSALYEIFFRDNLPNISSLLFTAFVFAFVVYIHAVRVELPITSRKHKGIVSTFPIALMYCSTSVVNDLNAGFSQVFNLSRFLYKMFPKNMFVRLLGIWDMQPKLGMIPTSGLCYYIFPPHSFKDIFVRPIFFVIFVVTNLAISGWFSASFVDSQEESASQVFKKIKAQDMQLRGIRDANAVDKLNEYIPTAAFLSGVITAAVILFCDLFSVIGSGSNIFLAASIINQYMKLLAKESAKRSGRAVIE